MPSLQGVGVLVTRPEQQALPLCRLLAAEGATGYRFPAIDIVPLPHRQDALRQLGPVERFDVIIFVSSTQFEGAVATELKKSKRIGKRYYLAYHGPNIHADAQRELLIGKNTVTVYTEDKKEEFTEIQELES